MPLTHPSRKLGTEKDVHLTYESCMANLHATGKPLMKRLPPVRCGGGCISRSVAPPSVQLCTDTCARQTNRTVLSFCTIVSSLLLHHWVLAAPCVLAAPSTLDCVMPLRWLLQLACARQTNSTHGFAHPNPNPTTAGLSTTPCNIGRRTGSR